MKDIILFITFHYFACLLFFLIIQKPLFCFLNRSMSSEKMNAKELRKIYHYGFVTDMIGASYLTTIPTLLLATLSFFPQADTRNFLLGCDVLLSIAMGLITISDTALYKFWQFKIDSSVFAYLRNLKGAFASVSALYVLTALVCVLLMSGLFFSFVWCAGSLVLPIPAISLSDWGSQAIFIGETLLILIVLFAIIRGIHHRPNNPCVAYYSKVPFYNHCALNPLYSLIYSLSIKDDFEGQFQCFNEAECQQAFEPLFPTTGTPQVHLLNTDRPNILFIIWESLSARYIGTLGGETGIMPRVEQLCEEGVLFTRCDCGSFRTDRGLVCLLSGYLGQPTTSIIKHTRKLPNLPALPRRLREVGYETMALHGGNCQVMHKTDYYLATGHNSLITQKELPDSAPTCQWGINDGYTFDWLYNDIQEKTRQGKLWYTTFQTLSSHEPFDVPFQKLADEKKNSFAYVDDCFGKFIDKLKASPAWNNLLIVCTGDHGFSHYAPIARDKYPHIPVLLLGGAVKQPMKINKIVGQTDIAATLLGQLNLPHEEFIFSRDVLAETYTYPFSLHTYNNGFLFRDETGFTHYDNIADSAVEGADEHRERLGKVILQTLYSDLSKR